MFDMIKARFYQGNQAIKDIKKALIKGPYRGFPGLTLENCNQCGDCVSVCPTQAIDQPSFTLDMGKCVFCGDCVRACKKDAITFTGFHYLSSVNRDALTVGPSSNPEDYRKFAMKSLKKVRGLFGRSLKLRQVSAGGCNGCEMELNETTNVNFDMGRFGFDFVASPRHADGIVITGPITENMADALRDTYAAVPEPKLIILTGSCAISGGLFAGSPSVNRGFLSEHPIDLFVPGCPVHPLTFINGLLDLLRKKA